MTDRLAEITARIDSVTELQSVVNAMKGIAAARAHEARSQIEAVESYAQIIALAMASLLPPDRPSQLTTKTGLLVFLAEQGFAGAFSERLLDSLPGNPTLFLIGSRGLSIAQSRDLTPLWSAALPAHPAAMPKLAQSITTAVYKALAAGQIDGLDVIFTHWSAGRPEIQRQPLFPIDLNQLPPSPPEPPLTQLDTATLLQSLGADYLHAQLCKAALHAFSAENEARLAAMTAAGSQIKTELLTIQASQRRVRQDAITAEIIELGTGVEAARNRP
jgi:F-type H+-transporting ATPase subunit gamma